MTQEELLCKVSRNKIVPVVKLDRAKDALQLGKALCEGGLPVAEVTFRTDAAEESIKILVKNFPEMLVGAGTVVNLEQAKRAVNAGAVFLVSPGINRKIMDFAVQNSIPIFPGCCTPTEIMCAMEYEISVVKFFPAKQYGGLETIKALTSPFPYMRFMPTGGINQTNIVEYLSSKNIFACGGSWMASDELINVGNFERIKNLTKEAVALVKII